MSAKKTMGVGDIELLQTPSLPMTADAMLEDFTHYFSRMLGRRTIRTQSPFLYQAIAQATRDRLLERLGNTQQVQDRYDMRRTCFISLEFMMGRLLRNALLNLGFEEETDEALCRLGLELEDVCDRESDAGLGSGGLGRLAACFLDSCATLNLPVIGYGIRYQYGTFHQRIENGRQVEEPDSWLREGFPWEIERAEFAQTVKFGGRSTKHTDSVGRTNYRWVDTHDVRAIPFDIPIPGFHNAVVNTLRLWSAEAVDQFDLKEFNSGSYADAVASKNEAEKITMVLSADDASESGKELRLRQLYFLASASLQDAVRSWERLHGVNFDHFADKHCFHLNDTHPAIAVPELVRILVDERSLDWDTAWAITKGTMAFTSHALQPEALEKWPVDLFRRMLPRLLEIIDEINDRFLTEVRKRWPGDNDRLRRMSLIEDGSTPTVRMAYLAIVASYSINGVAKSQSKLLRDDLFRDFNDLWPQRFNNKSNGVTQRRWLASCNVPLNKLITETIGDAWMTDLTNLEKLKPMALDEEFKKRWRQAKLENKRRLASEIAKQTGISVVSEVLFDVHVKRIHEFKRQLLNVLHSVHLYDRIRRGDGDGLTPRVIIIGGKAAPGYTMAKSIIKVINNVAEVINSDPAMADKLRLVFFPDFNVSAMELICPAADLSEQISTAGREASGTGNMKMMMNGALTIGTLNGANIDILEAVGHENFFLFGLSAEKVLELRKDYEPRAIVNADEDLSRVMNLLAGRHFSRFEPGVFDGVLQSIFDPSDPCMTAADFRGYVTAQKTVGEVYKDTSRWTAMSILNTASSGRFSADCSISSYNKDIWRLSPIKLDSN